MLLTLDISGVFLGNIPPYFFLITASCKNTQVAVSQLEGKPYKHMKQRLCGYYKYTQTREKW
jgi:hypothetical protein